MNYLAALIIVQETVAQKSIVSKLFKKKTPKRTQKMETFEEKNIFCGGFLDFFQKWYFTEQQSFALHSVQLSNN